MNNTEAYDALAAQKRNIMVAMDALREFEAQTSESNWSNTVKAKMLSAIKTSAAAAGADLSGWEGKS